MDKTNPAALDLIAGAHGGVVKPLVIDMLDLRSLWLGGLRGTWKEAPPFQPPLLDRDEKAFTTCTMKGATLTMEDIERTAELLRNATPTLDRQMLAMAESINRYVEQLVMEPPPRAFQVPLFKAELYGMDFGMKLAMPRFSAIIDSDPGDVLSLWQPPTISLVPQQMADYMASFRRPNEARRSRRGKLKPRRPWRKPGRW